MRNLKVALAAASAVVVGWAGVAQATEYAWRGTDATSPTLASVAKNWSPEGVPGATDTVLLDASSASKDLEWDLAHGVAGWTQTADYAGTVTFRTGRDAVGKKVEYFAIGEKNEGSDDKWFKVSGNVSILGGKWTHPAQQAFDQTDEACKNGLGIWRLLIDVGGTLEIGANATIDVAGNGFPLKTGPGRGTDSCSTGAAHGGQGGWCGYVNANNKCYGSIRNPVCLGSGGGWSTGGGAVYLKVKESMTLNGSVVADSSQAKTAWYGASGGSVYISAASISGSGSVSANGSPISNGGGGTGGRIAIKLSADDATFADFTLGNVTATGRSTGHSGTIYLETPSDAAAGGVLWVRGNGTDLDSTRAQQYSTALDNPDEGYSFAEVRLTEKAYVGLYPNSTVFAASTSGDGTGALVSYGGQLQFPAGYAPSNVHIRVYADAFPFAFLPGDEEKTVCIGSNTELRVDTPQAFPGGLHLYPGAKVSHSAGGTYQLDLTVQGDVFVDEGAAIDVTACGYACDKGYTIGNVSGIGVATDTDGGGSHGGLGRKSGTAKCYGSVTEPLEHGAGGHQQSGVNGGGIVKLNVGGMLHVDGTIRSDGKEHVYGNDGYTGGAGGSVNIRAARLTGRGSVEANGGHGRNASWGCGGGGRIAVRLTDVAASFGPTPRVFARGGELASQRKTGGPGTVYLQTAAQGEGCGTLVIDNDGYTPAYGVAQIGQYVTCEQVGTVVITNCGSLKLVDGKTLAFAGDWRSAPDAKFAGDTGTTVRAVGDATARIIGTNTFVNFACEVPGKTLRFGTADSLLTIPMDGRITLAGAAGRMLTLTTDVEGERWPLALLFDSVCVIDRVAVDHGDASYGNVAAVAVSSTDNGENVNWNITGAIEPGSPISWVGTAGTEWGNVDNWDAKRLPVDTDVVTIPVTQNAPKLADNLSINTLIVFGALDLNGYDLTVTNDFACSGTLGVSGVGRLAVGHSLSLAGATLTGAPAVVSVGGTAASSADLGGHMLLRVELGRGSGLVSVSRGCRARELVVDSGVTLQIAAGVDFDVGELSVGGDGSTGLIGEDGVWSLKVGVGAFVSGVRVKGCDASAGLAVVADAPSTDLGGNVNWTFPTAGVSRWTGEADQRFENADNWSTKAVPAADDRVVIPAGAKVLASADAVAVRALEVEGELHVATNLAVAGTVVVRNGGTLTLDSPSTIGVDLMLRRGATLTHAGNSSKELFKLDLDVAGDVEIEDGAKIDATSRGLVGCYGPGAGVAFKNAASHGGLAGWYTDNGTYVKPCYGSVFAPDRVGSGGGWGDTLMSAGGAIRVNAAGTLRVDGDVLADAEQEKQNGYYTGSGGSVFLTASTFLGSGTISARGGRITGERAAGAGGRISIVQTTGTDWSDGFAPTLTAHGGQRISGTGVNQGTFASAGTIYRELRSRGEGRGEILIDGASSAVITYADGTQLPAGGEGSESAKELEGVSVVLKNGGVLSLTEDLTIEELEILRDDKKETSVARVRLNGHTLTIRSHLHKNGKRGWPTNWQSTVFVPGADADGNPGKIVWKPLGLMIFMK